ncbi:GNAT family N-acetyltransferase [Mycolicibacterium sp. P9-64]|uniref:GNAT family N-acetyltransferase n=1 Tax=Mycolicibacterium sp. P9-64 TaxID=2024612 RepID=UPI0011ED3C16|nr:GNAT family N-acetyltransferase [Mycolicibacterium sp. P9-64]KAA0081262.1 GNAT family N-acetyltransferase [Mycolicibacterium sp. P9-64]
MSTSSDCPADDPALRKAHVLDNAVFAALTGPHAHLARSRGRAVRYLGEVSAFAALPDEPDGDDWNDLAALVEPHEGVALTASGTEAPPNWTELVRIPCIQMIGAGVEARPDGELPVASLAPDDLLRLSDDDVPDMLELVALTKPGPFAPRTIEMGSYVGIREEGRLIAMAGERLHPPGWTEISAVCTAPEHRGRGLATRLMQAVAYGIRERGETPFLHVASSNTTAMRLYEAMGYLPRASFDVVALRPPT